MKAFFVFILLISIPCFADDRNCNQIFQVVGPGGKTTDLKVVNRLYEADEAMMQKHAEEAEEKYKDYDYRYKDDPTVKKDCAGHVVQTLWGKGPYIIGTQDFIKSVIRPFGEARPYYDAKEGDIIVYANEGHVAVVIGTEYGKILIETKDRFEPVYIHPLNPYDETDPLINLYGKPRLYRVPKGLQFIPKSSECDQSTASTGTSTPPPPVTSKPLTADPNAWGLYEIVVDPDKQNEYWKYTQTTWKNVNEVHTFKTDYYSLLHQDWVDNERTQKGQEYHIIINMDSPPAQIRPGDKFPLKVTGTCTKTKMEHWVKRWGVYEIYGGGIDIVMQTPFETDSKFKPAGPYVGKGEDHEGGFIGSAKAVYHFTVSQSLSDEFTIAQKGLAHFKYRKGATPIQIPKK